MRFAFRPACVPLSFFALIVAASGGLAQGDPVVTLQAHHAHYRLSLLRSDGPKAPADVNGLIDYEFSGSSCAGFATVFRQFTNLEPQEGQSRTSDMLSATFEDGTSHQFRFDTETSYDSGQSEALLGKASKTEGGPLAIELKAPGVSTASLGAALFPTEHLRRVIGAARAGQKTLSAPVYDGSDTGKKLFDTFTVIGTPISKAPEGELPAEAAFRNLQRWPVSISYYERGSNSASPAYVMSFELYENGVSRSLRLDYGAFELKGSLVELSVLATPGCGTAP